MAREDIAAAKATLREAMKVRREGLHDTSGASAKKAAAAAGAIAARWAATGGAAGEPVVSIYAAIGAELDPLPLLGELEALGFQGALPVIGRKGEPLTFRAYTTGDDLDERTWGIREPKPHRPVVVPDVLILPLLAFDGEGWRLGYGGGFYDRTLAGLRAGKQVAAIGLAYAGQRVDAVPHADYDEPMDGVLTPSGLEQFDR